MHTQWYKWSVRRVFPFCSVARGDVCVIVWVPWGPLPLRTAAASHFVLQCLFVPLGVAVKFWDTDWFYVGFSYVRFFWSQRMVLTNPIASTLKSYWSHFLLHICVHVLLKYIYSCNSLQKARYAQPHWKHWGIFQWETAQHNILLQNK